MLTPREGATTTLLPNGKVLLAGGDQINGGILASAELYDPATGTWKPTLPFITGRRGFTLHFGSPAARSSSSVDSTSTTRMPAAPPNSTTQPAQSRGPAS
ncbi:MAG TPA: kelch repeat-containing protein [Verrucomicrobiae bacterium]|nr:kelch repeat-containing protein [Verrucomicrobiae bacterium]